MRIYWISEFTKGNIGMMARPRGNDWLEDEIEKLKNYGVNCVISLLEQSEIYELEIEKENFYCDKYQIDYINFPIRDRGIPEKEAFLKLILEIDRRLQNAEKIAVHCRMGIGRTSMVLAGILIKNGMNSDIAFDLLSEKRTLKVPDTEIQSDWIKRIKNDLHHD